jgi:hypothetical protein
MTLKNGPLPTNNDAQSLCKIELKNFLHSKEDHSEEKFFQKFDLSKQK